MNSFIVSFHQEDNVDTMQVQKLNQEEFRKSTTGGTRRLFELDTNFGFFIFFDAEDEDSDLSYLTLHYEEDSEEPSGCYSFEMKDFYEFMALFMQDAYFHEENDEEEGEEEEEYGPLHHLAHLLHHIVEEGKHLDV
ncbi:cytosolic protein [Bacillus sp. V59.32b]|uniref:cytosolic protein n=1 Tax=Bacillus sp. V59.32b TaxID=1758642 RepID=UPI000E3E6B36|nr:cytosolic protein [Bacillus sp. V59.32b]RFU66538.1 cytosolic protein [Bacillus sp. V59.32b]